MSVLNFVRNKRAVLKLSRPKPVDPRWPSDLPAPIHAADTRNKERAVSALCNLILRDGSRLHCADVTNEQAADIANWLRG